MKKIENMNYIIKKKFFKILKKKYRTSGFIKKGSFPEVWNYEFISIHNSIILSSVVVEKKFTL